MPPKVILSITALNAALFAGTIFLHNGEQKQVVLAAESQPDALYAAATKACRDEIDQSPSKTCGHCKTRMGNDTKEVEKWCCGGAVMSERVQACLDVAAAKVPGQLAGVAEAIE